MIRAQLLSSKELDYPSGSVLNFYEGQLYLAGDDATDLLILDTEFNVLRSVALFPETPGRIEKAVKADIEAGDFIRENNADILWLFGSGSLKPYRDWLFKYNPHTGELLRSDLGQIYKRIEKQGISMLNIEAAEFVKDHWLLGSRSNRVQKQNYLITLPRNFPDDQQNAQIKIIYINPPDESAGISGMAYDETKDALFFTFSVEETPNTYDDGERGDSFLGMISEIAGKLGTGSLIMDAWLHLPAIDVSFDKMKIESVTIGNTTNEKHILYLAADNDDGKTVLFKISVEC